MGIDGVIDARVRHYVNQAIPRSWLERCRRVCECLIHTDGGPLLLDYVAFVHTLSG